MFSLSGCWLNETISGDTFIVTTQTLRDDGTFETEIRYAFVGGCRQHILQRGRYEVSEGQLRLRVEHGETEMTGCEDSAQNFALRPFTSEERDETERLLASPIGYHAEESRLVTSVETPMGAMQVVYDRVAEV